MVVFLSFFCVLGFLIFCFIALASDLCHRALVFSMKCQVPNWVGFNIEIKYPIEKKHKHLRHLDVYECNQYIDCILECVLLHAGTRRVVFSCFDPDICILLHAKQPRYPVFFLTCSGTQNFNYEDATCTSIRHAWTFAKAQRLQGIVAESSPILQDTSSIKRIKETGLLLFTWGDKNTLLHNVIVQKQLGVDGTLHVEFFLSVFLLFLYIGHTHTYTCEILRFA